MQNGYEREFTYVYGAVSPMDGAFDKMLTKLARQFQGMREAFEYIQDYVSAQGLRMWLEEFSRIVYFNVEMESGVFRQHDPEQLLLTAAEKASGVNLILTTYNNLTCNAVKDTVHLSFNPQVTVNAGTPITICANNAVATLNGSSPITGAGTWSGAPTRDQIPSSP